MGEKICIFFPIGEKHAFPPFIHSLSIIFFPQTCHLSIFFLGGPNRKIYTRAWTVTCYALEHKKRIIPNSVSDPLPG